MPEIEDLELTEEQEAIRAAAKAGQDALIQALAGTGKTTTCCMASYARRVPGQYWAFNRPIADVAADTFPGRIKCNTFHGFANRALRANDDERMARLNKSALPPWEVADEIGMRSGAWIGPKSFSKTKLAVLVRQMVNKFCYSDDDSVQMEHVPFVRGIERNVKQGRLEDYHEELAEHLLPYARAYWDDICSPIGQFRFEHDHYFKIWALSRPKLETEMLIIDEAQDLNPVVIDLLAHQTHVQKLVCGDSNQQIYGWRGAVDALATFDVDNGGDIELILPLTQSWRFGPELAQAANVFLVLLQSPFLLSGDPAKMTEIRPFNEFDVPPQAVLTRTNAGGLEELMSLQERFPEARIGVSDRIKEFLSFAEQVAKLEAGKNVFHPDLMAFNNWKEVVEYVADTDDDDFKLRVQLIEKYGLTQLCSALEDTVTRNPDITITTAHTAKGREWDSVRVAKDFSSVDDSGVRRELSPAEHRLRYVAVTRAKKHLDPGPLSYELGLDEVAESDG